MRIKVSLAIVFFILLVNTGMVFSQGEAPENPPVKEAPSADTEAQWIWGDVVSIDTAAKTVLVKYLDYETDMEKEINISVDDKTAYENVKSIDEIKLQDTLSVDYIVNAGGKNIAKNISIERPEAVEALPQGNAEQGQKAAPGLE
ncbi:MAG: hypothetical protein HY350_04100 [Candidatus Omnitrophica bacterium]|nr:hypothetical protein [Candidatus Omnitrophota bacterium]